MSSVRIRTYRHGLGDSFLLTFTGESGQQTNVLIDCGVLIGTPNGTDVMKQVVSDVAETTSNRVDIVVATHEHWDHVSGFNQARDEFDALDMGRIWMAWTEDPDDDLATELRQEREQRTQSLAAALQLWQQRVAAAPDQANDGSQGKLEATRHVLEFFGELGAHEARRKTSDAMEYLRQRGTPKRYLRPGAVLDLPGQSDVRVFVLGPPRDLKWLKKERPSTRDPETYTGDHALTMSECFMAAVANSVDSASSDELAFPFDGFYRKTTDDPEQFFIDEYLNGDEWRKIDADWLGTTSDLALALDSDTNNTSLVLAFELGDGGDVLLFTGDAQVGNWLSWHHVDWDGHTGVDADDLLARTVFYKVAHHGSHNATLRELGLEKMTNSRLMAMVPVDRETAAKQHWAMPFEPLWDRLEERCRGRVLRSDELLPGDARLRRMSPEDRDAFKAMVTRTTDLFIDIELDRGTP